MSNYRDDVNDTAVATGSTWLRLRTIAESTARARDVLLYGLAIGLTESAVASDQFIDRVTATITESAQVSEQYSQSVKASSLVLERARGADAIVGRYRTLLVEQGSGADSVTGSVLALVSERATAADTVIGQRHVAQLVAERFKAQDVLVGLQRTLLQESAQAADLFTGRLHAKVLVVDSGLASDDVFDHTSARPLILVEKARASADAFGPLRAHDLVVDSTTVGWDELLSTGGLIGQAWGAEAGAWYMSRYAPFAFTGLVVIDGAAYATGPDGVYALDGTTETMDAEIRTGAIDMTGDVLAMPVESRIEYELQGNAWMDVTQTQGGAAAQTYRYPLNARPVADALTNARFLFGRGLKGRTFAYTLRLTGQQAYINDWTVIAAASKRSL